MNYRLIIGLLFCVQNMFAQVVWQPSFKVALAIAKASKKIVSMECYHPECPHCKVLNKNVEQAAISKFLNDKYINVKINLSKTEDVKILDGMNIRLPNYPMFLYFTADGKFINYLDPSEDPKTLVNQLNNEIGQSCSTCESEKSQSAERNIKCAVFSNISTNFELNNRLSDSLFHKIKAEGGENSISSWVYFSKTVSGMDNDFFRYWIKNVPTAAKYQVEAGPDFAGKEKDKYFGIIQKKIMQMGKEKTIALTDVNNVKDAIKSTGAEDNMVLVYTWEIETKYLLQNQKFAETKTLLNTLSNKYPNAQTNIALFRVINENTKSPEMNSFFEEKKEATLKGLTTAKEKSQYFEQAAMFYAKAKNKIESQKAIDDAKANGMDAKALEQLKKTCAQL